MSERQIAEYFSNHPSGMCGRFRRDQLVTYQVDTRATIRPGFGLLKAGIASLLLVAWSNPLPAQTPTIELNTIVKLSLEDKDIPPANFSSHTVSGLVRDEEGNALPGVSIMLKGSKVGTVTDLHGKFKFPHELQPGDVLLFMFIGYETKEFRVPKHVDENLEISMTLDVCVLMGEVAVNALYDEDVSIFRKVLQKVKAIF